MFSDGDRVYALFEGTKKWFPATVVGSPDDRGYYDVRFSNGEMSVVRSSQIKREGAMRSAKSPARKRSTSRGRARSRTRSRGRSPGRPRARSRSKSTERRSKSPETPTRSSRRTTRANNVNVVTPTRQSARIAAHQNDEVEKKSSTESVKVVESRTRVGKTRQYEWGGPLAALACALTTPIVLVLLLRHCTKKDCTLFKLPSLPKGLSSVWSREMFYFFLGLAAIVRILSHLPLGRTVEGPAWPKGAHRAKYMCNGPAMFFILLAIVGVAGFRFHQPVHFLHDHLTQFVVLHCAFSALASVFLYLKARRAHKNELNPNGNTGNVLYDWFVGHEFGPRMYNLDIKFNIVARGQYLLLTLYNLSLVAKVCTSTHAAPSNTLLLVVLLQFFYSLDGILYEEEALYRWDIRHQGVGYRLLLVYGMVRMVFSTIPARYIYTQTVSHSNAMLVAIFFLWASGYFIYRSSSSQKFYFRKNSFDPSLAHLQSIPTQTGRRLLVSSWWGLVRHPNYLGEIIMGLAICLACGFKHFFPYLYLVYLLAELVLRTVRAEKYCKKAYSQAWNIYCEKVPHRFIPKVL